MSAFDPKRTSIALPQVRLEPVRCRLLSLGATMRRREFLGLLWQYSSRLAARGGCAAGRADAAHCRAQWRARGRSGRSGPRRGVPAGGGMRSGPRARSASCPDLISFQPSSEVGPRANHSRSFLRRPSDNKKPPSVSAFRPRAFRPHKKLIRRLASASCANRADPTRLSRWWKA